MRLIDADAERERLKKGYCEECTRKGNYGIFGAACTPCWVMDAIEEFDNAQEVEAEPVRHGRWITIFHDTAKCLCCGWWQRTTMYYLPDDIPAFSKCYRFCTSCGAQMNGGADNA